MNHGPPNDNPVLNFSRLLAENKKLAEAMDKKFDGMRDLMDAEERASKIVNEARQGAVGRAVAPNPRRAHLASVCRAAAEDGQRPGRCGARDRRASPDEGGCLPALARRGSRRAARRCVLRAWITQPDSPPLPLAAGPAALRPRPQRLGDPEEQRRTLSAKADEDVVEMRKTFEEAKEGVIKQLVEAVARTEVTIPESWEMRMKLSKSA